MRLSASTRAQTASFSLLPATILTSSLYVQAITCFRHTVAQAFISTRLGLPLPSECVCVCVCVAGIVFTIPVIPLRCIFFVDYVNKPSLNVFLKALDQADVMDSTLVSVFGVFFPVIFKVCVSGLV